MSRILAKPDEEATMLVGLTPAGVRQAILAFIAAFGSARRARCFTTGRPVPPRVPFGPAKSVGVVAASLATACLAGRTSDAWTAVVMTVAIVAVITLPATIAALLRDREPSRTSPPAAQLDAEHGRAN